MAVLRVRDNNGYLIDIPTIKGDRGEQGPPGPRGDTGVTVPLEAGLFALYVNEAGHLILRYHAGTTPPDLQLNEQGHLIYTITF